MNNMIVVLLVLVLALIVWLLALVTRLAALPTLAAGRGGAGVARANDSECGQNPQEVTYTQDMTVSVKLKNTGVQAQNDCSVKVVLMDAGGTARAQGTADPGDDEITITGTKVRKVQLQCQNGGEGGRCKFTYSITAS